MNAGIPVLGVEPAANVAEAAIKKGIRTSVRFFGEATAAGLKSEFGPADLLLGNNVLAHVPDINDFVKGMQVLLGEKGTITMEFPHLLNLIRLNQFDTIYHEHFSYLSFLTVQRIFAHHGITLFDVEEIPTHGGSLRIYGKHDGDSTRGVSDNVKKLVDKELSFGLKDLHVYREYQEQVKETKRKLLSFLIEAKNAGKTIVGYGAPGKGNTLLNYCGIRQDFLDYTVDLSTQKQGKYTPGCRLPILDPAVIKETRPDYVLVLPWNLIDEISRQHSYISEWGGKFVIPRAEQVDRMDTVYDFAIVGGGIIGVSAAYSLQTSYPRLRILLLEKETDFGQHQTGHNSGVMHSGLYYTPGSKKADFCVRGHDRLVEFAKEHRISHEICGKVVVATDPSELPFLEGLFRNGLANNVPGIEKISAEQVKRIEPFVECISGLFVPSTGIIDFVAVTKKMVEIIGGLNNRSSLLTSHEVKSIESRSDGKTIITGSRRFHARNLIFCAGLQADRLAKMDRIKIRERIVGFRGDYYKLADHAKHKVKNLVYPVPDPRFPFLGVHFTRMIDGEVECGPNAVLTFKREGYRKTDFDFRDAFDALTYAGTWKLLAGNLGFAMSEYRRSFSKRLFLKTLQRMIPSLRMDDIVPGRAGVRAQYLGLDGDTKEDFKIEYSEDSIHVLNSPSPAATASLVIGEEIRKMAEKRFNLT